MIARKAHTPHAPRRPDEVSRAGLGRWAWLLAVAAAIVPFLSGLSWSRVFYIRDLSMFFWGRHISFRRELLSGHFPLWDPYVAAGQSAATDALRQMFFPPAVALRLIGNEALGFNLWVAAPFPLAALGAWMFFRRRFSLEASTLGAIAFAVSGPIVATGNFPNMAWSVAAMPWLLWAADRLAATPGPRAVAVLAVVTACQALAGEPVTLFATLSLVGAFIVIVDQPQPRTARQRRRHLTLAAWGIAQGLALAAVQLVPLASAAAASNRAAGTLARDVWSLHPLALFETVSLHVYGNYYTAQSLAETPWLPPLNVGREPFLFSLYYGVPLLGLAMLGLAIKREMRWSLFWGVAGVASLIGAFGAYTPIYPFIRDHLPLLPSFRFPAKYMVVSSMAVAACAAAGWDGLARASAVAGAAAVRRPRLLALAFVSAIGAIASVAAAACMYFPDATAFRLFDTARSMGSSDPVGAAEFMFRTLPRQASVVLLLSLATAALVWIASATRKEANAARWLLGGLIVADLMVRAWGINPAFDRRYLSEPAWLAQTKAHPDARVYIGSKHEGTLDQSDLDSSGPVYNPSGLVGSASRAAVNGAVNFEPSAWRVREMVSYDLPVLWPRRVTDTLTRFFDAPRDVRDLFLDRTGVRYRVLPPAQAGTARQGARVPYLFNAYLYDWGDKVSARVGVIGTARVVPDTDQQIDALFASGWDARAVVLVDRETAPAGTPGPPASSPSATIVTETSNRVVVDAAAAAPGGYLVLLDTYSEDWHVRVDGQAATLLRADGLFRAVRLAAGPHVVEFVYRPRAVFAGLAVSVAALLLLIGCVAWPVRTPPAGVARAGS